MESVAIAAALNRLEGRMKKYHEALRESAAVGHIADITAKTAAMSSLRDAVQELADKCDGDDRPECPILGDLEGSAPIPK
jgi:hypothetical protein